MLVASPLLLSAIHIRVIISHPVPSPIAIMPVEKLHSIAQVPETFLNNTPILPQIAGKHFVVYEAYYKQVSDILL